MLTGAYSAIALLIVSRFRFRTVDTLRLAFWCFGVRKRSSIAVAALLVLSATALSLTSVFMLPFVSGALVLAAVAAAKPLLAAIEERYVIVA